MIEESLNANCAAQSHAEAPRMPYHSPKFVSLGPIQSLVQAVTGIGPDGSSNTDGTHS
jgi:hypothetical protein